MIDLPQTQPPGYEQLVSEGLERCGLRKGDFTVRYEDELQSFEIVIGRAAGASVANLDCIRAAVGKEMLTFEDNDLHRSYTDRVSAEIRPRMLADAVAELAKHGILEGFPERSGFPSDALFAEALERHCGMTPGAFFVEGPKRPDRQARDGAAELARGCKVLVHDGRGLLRSRQG